MASCNLCSSFKGVRIQYNHDLAREHAKTHFLQMRMIDDGIDMNQVFEKCFPNFGTTKTNGRASFNNSRRKSLYTLCHSLITRKSISSSSPHITCEKCDETLTITDRRKVRRPTVLIDHASHHLKLDLYECRHCVQEFNNKSTLSNHLLTNHNLRATIGHFRNKTDDFVGELSAMIKVCFGNEKKTTHSHGATLKSGAMSIIRGRTKGSHLAVERQLLCYRLIRKMAERNGYVKCSLCSKGIRATAMCIKHHAYLHLPTPLYRCRLCAEAFFGVGATTTHLQRVHALPFLEQNYECLADEYHAEVVEIMKQCYGDQIDSAKEVAFRNVNESNVFKKSTHSKLTLNRRLLCYRLIRKRATVDRRVQCRLCSKQIGVKNGNGFSSDRPMQHALLHLGKPVYRCTKCPETYVTRYCISEHLNAKHALPLSDMYYKCFADQFHDELEGILRECYGNESKGTTTSVKREPNSTASASQQRSKLTIERQALCNELVREYSDRANESLQCRLCNNRISVKGTRIARAINHALVHLETPMYRCKICSEMSITRTNVIQHVTRKHALPTANNYECSADQFHAEIVDMLRKCYNNEISNDSKPFKSRTRAEVCVRKRLNGSKLAVERQLFCYRLITKFVNSDGKVECRLCKKRPVAKRGEHNVCGPALTHAMVSYMKNHLKVTHALPLAGNYECLADEYHSEILSQLSQCYGEL